MRVAGVDPGTFSSGYILWNTESVTEEECGQISNDCLNDTVYSGRPDMVAIELITCYGLVVGKETFQSLLVIGRLQEYCRVYDIPCVLVTRAAVRLHMCGTAKSGDTNIRRVLLDRYGYWEHGKTGKGTKEHPGPLYNVSKHVVSALAVAVTAAEREDLRKTDFFS